MEIEESYDFSGCEDSCQDVVALKIFDQCKIQGCETLGPVVSKEDCECIILSPFDHSKNFGRIILPGQPIMAPQCTARAKIIKNSFCLTHIEFININRSSLKKNYWSVDIIYHFEFTLQLLGINMKPLKVVCCPTTFDEMKKARKEKEWIKAGISFTSQVLLYGGDIPTSQVFSDIFITNQACNYNDPHILIEINAYPLDIMLKDPCFLTDQSICNDACCEPICNDACCKPICNDACCKPICNDACCKPICNDACCKPICNNVCCNCCEPICNDSYCEPFHYICISIGLAGIIKLVRLISGVIHAKPCADPKICDHCTDDPCKCFGEMKFPKELF